MSKQNESFKVAGDAEKLAERAARANRKRAERQAKMRAEEAKAEQAREAEYRRQQEEAKRAAEAKAAREAEEQRVRDEEARMWEEANKAKTKTKTGQKGQWNAGYLHKIHCVADHQSFGTLNDALRAMEPIKWKFESDYRRSVWTKINRALKKHGKVTVEGHTFWTPEAYKAETI